MSFLRGIINNYYFHQFYIFNFLLCLIYPLIRYYGLTSFQLKLEDTWGFKRENQIITGITTLIIVRYVRYFTNSKKFIHDLFFYIKCGTMIILCFIDIKLCLWYLFACVVIWILFRPPLFSGPSNVIYIASEDYFQEKILTKNKTLPLKNVDVYWLVIFYSNSSEDCVYVSIE
jgi:hypothetical protein